MRLQKKMKNQYLIIKGSNVIAEGGGSLNIAKKRLKALTKDNGQLYRLDVYMIVEVKEYISVNK